MQLKSFILKNKLLSFVSFIFFFSHIYLWDLQNIIRAEGIESIETNFLRYLILFSLIGILINKNIIDKYFLFFFLIFILQSSINYFFYDQIVNLKEFGSFIFFLLLYIVVKLENERIINQLKKFFEIFIIINFLGLIIFLFFKDYQLGSACNFLLIDSIIYHENSHYGMMSTCMIVYYIYSAKNLRNNFFFSLLIFNSFIYLSVTFIAGLFVSFLACLFINILHKNKNNVPILLGLIILLLILSVKNNCSDRLNYLIKKTDNDLKILNNFESVSDEFNEKSQSFETRNKIYNELLPYRNLSSQVYNIAIHNTIYTINNDLLVGDLIHIKDCLMKIL